jgi:hypothetical protein
LVAVVVHVGFADVGLWLVQPTKVPPRVDVFFAKVVLGSRSQITVGQISRRNNRALGTKRFMRTVVIILHVVIIVVLQGGFVVVRGARRPTVIIIVVIPVVLSTLATTMIVVELTLLIKVVVSSVATWAAKGASPRRPTVVLL